MEITDKYIPVPVPAAKNIADTYNKNQVIVICSDEEHGKIHFTSYGKTAVDKLEAARGSFLIQKYHFNIEIPDGTEAPIGFENFEWNNESNDFIEKSD